MVEAEAKPVILLVEDNLGDIELTRDGLEATGVPHELLVARDGAEALAILRRHSRWKEAPRPSIVLLDLNLPKRDGREVLSDIKSDPALMTIPVLVYTSSDAEEEIRNCYNLHANAYITKASHAPEIVDTLKLVVAFWLGRVRLASS